MLNQPWGQSLSFPPKSTFKPIQAHSSSLFEYILANSNHWFLTKNINKSHGLRFLHPDHLLSVKLTRELFTQECKLAWRLARMRACVTLTSTEARHLEESWRVWISNGTEWSSAVLLSKRERGRDSEKHTDMKLFLSFGAHCQPPSGSMWVRCSECE